MYISPEVEQAGCIHKTSFMPKQNFSSQNLDSLLRRNPQVQRLISQARSLQRLQQQLEKHLPPELAEHCQVAAFSDGVLTLYTQSPAWAAKLRYLTADLLKKLRNDTTFGPVDTIRVQSRPPATRAEPAPTGRRTGLSAATRELLRQVAESTDDADLRRALLRLAKN